MAYANSVTTVQGKSDPSGKGYFIVTITETGASSSDEASFEVPTVGRILRQTSKLTSGSGSTVDPIVGIVTVPADVNLLYSNGTAASSVNNEPNTGEGTPYYAPEGCLFHRSQVDSASDNAITTVYLIHAGW